MSIMGDDKQLTIEKLRDYPSITVEDRSLSTKPTLSSSFNSGSVNTTTGLLNKPNNHQLSIVATSGSQNIGLGTTRSELKQAVDRKIPLYTSIDSTARTVRPVHKTVERTSMVEKSKSLSNSQIFIPIEAFERTKNVDKPPNKQSEKTVSDQSANKEAELNSTEHENIQALSQAVGKNIQKNVLSLTPISTAKTVSSNCVSSPTTYKEKNIPKFIPSLPKVPAKRLISAPVKKQIDLNLKSNSASLCDNVKKISVINSLEKNRMVVKKSVTEEVSSSILKPRGVTKSPSVITENSTGNCKEAVTTKKVTSPIISPKSTAVQVSFTNSCQKTIEDTVVRSLSTSPSASTKRVKLYQLSSLNDDSNKAVLDALNSGSNVHTGSVTVSKQPIAPCPDQTMRNVLSKPIVELGDGSSSETVDQSKLKQFNSSCPPGNFRRNGKVTDTTDEVLNVSFSPTSNIIVSSSTPADDASMIRLNASSSLFINSESTDIYDENSVPEKKHDELDCLTISSDEEEDEELEDFEQVVGSSHTSELSVSIMSKEPIVQKSESCDYKIGDETMNDAEIDEALEETNAEGYFSLLCRTIRIGSYKVSPRTPVIVSKYGLRLVVPSTTSSESVVLKIPSQRIRKVLIHFGRTLPVVFYYLHPAMGMKIRQILNMHDPVTAYFDPTSTNDTHKRITLLPEKFSDVHEICFPQVYPGDDKLEKLSQNEANALLLRSVPREARDKIQKVPPNPVQAIMVYPPPPAIGGISINTEDYSCLAEDVFLNDVIIDFYLKYLYLQMLDEDRQKIHIFSSFFYKRLTDKATPLPRHLQSAAKSADGVISAAEIRHNRVKNWTKNIDLFSKDFIVIPLNENQHWFLAVICFPGLKGPVRFSDNTPIVTYSKNIEEEGREENISGKKHAESGESSETIIIGSNTITPLKGSKANALVTFLDDNDVEERDEAEATDEEVNINSSCEDTDEEEVSSEVEKEVVERRPRREPIKQPCILIFDSLAGASRARIIATLREYLKVEYKIKHGEDRDFSKNVVKGAVPRVPQQDNYTDCGLFVLQYVEHFLQYKITDYHIPIKTLRDWFDPTIVSHKRQQIQLLLLGLMQEQGIDVESLNLPKLNFSEEPSDYDEDDGMYDSDEYYEGPLYHYDIDYERGSHMRPQYEHDSDENNYDPEDDDEIVQNRYGLLDSGEEMQNTESDESDANDIYKGLENPEVLKQKRYRQNLHRRMVVNISRYNYGDVEVGVNEGAEEETINDGEEGVLREDDAENEQLSSEIEATLENVNRGSVSICRLTPKLSGIRTRSSGSAGVTSTISSTISSTTSKEIIIADLKSIRPFEAVDSSGSESSSPKKKFKVN